ncbi:MAG: hypothetical protein Q4C55_08255 [Eubacterium sp.]|nr:hypothetical protein [Eubacterium sp.]
MESLNNTWTISEVSVPVGAPRRREDSASGAKRKKKSRSTGRRQKTKRIFAYKRVHMKTTFSWMLLTGAVIFALAIGILFQQSVISQLNDDVRTMKTTLDEKIAMNDSKSGALIENSDWASIEATARSYGMQELSPSQYAYETGMETQQASTDSQENQSWLASLFN